MTSCHKGASTANTLLGSPGVSYQQASLHNSQFQQPSKHPQTHTELSTKQAARFRDRRGQASKIEGSSGLFCWCEQEKKRKKGHGTRDRHTIWAVLIQGTPRTKAPVSAYDPGTRGFSPCPLPAERQKGFHFAGSCWCCLAASLRKVSPPWAMNGQP